MRTPPKAGTKALDAIDSLLADIDLAPAPAACDLCAAVELCGRCAPQRST